MANSKKQILHTALKLFLNNSYTDVSLQDIVNEVGLTKGAFYHYYTGKEQVFAEAVEYFCHHVTIPDYSTFPKTSLKEFYKNYLKVIQKPDDFDDTDDDLNFFVFLSEASKRISDFQKIYAAPRQEELGAWTKIVGTAKRKREIKTSVPDEELAVMFLDMSDGIVMTRHISRRKGQETFKKLQKDWDNLYSLLKIKEHGRLQKNITFRKIFSCLSCQHK
jgi:AcrR family transcriptional regulator